VARTLPRDLQKLAGYTIGAYALGYVDDVRDPGALLREMGDGVGSAEASTAGGSAPASFGGADGVRPNMGR
jgi:hypothetical protein